MRLKQFTEMSLEGMEILNAKNAADYVGKRVHFFSKQYSANYDSEGIGVITAYDPEAERPFTFEVETGDSLRYAFKGWDDDYCIGDADRPVVIREL